MTQRILRWPSLQQRIGGCSRTTVDRWIKAGQFPAPIKIGPTGPGGAIGWIESEVDEWLAAKAAEREGAAA